jgi:ribosome-associated protein
MSDPYDEEDYDDTPSKSARKREMLALQELGESLVNLTEKQLAQIPLPNEQLATAVRECRQIPSRGARKRHLQLIGKIMRTVDATPILQALETLHNTQREKAAAFHQLEQLRDDMLAAGASGVELAMARFPEADRQQLRQLLLQHGRELKNAKPPAASRKLFRYLRDLQEAYGDDD